MADRVADPAEHELFPLGGQVGRSMILVQSGHDLADFVGPDFATERAENGPLQLSSFFGAEVQLVRFLGGSLPESGGPGLGAVVAAQALAERVVAASR